jgi:hypothetical protein
MKRLLIAGVALAAALGTAGFAAAQTDRRPTPPVNGPLIGIEPMVDSDATLTYRDGPNVVIYDVGLQDDQLQHTRRAVGGIDRNHPVALPPLPLTIDPEFRRVAMNRPLTAIAALAAICGVSGPAGAYQPVPTASIPYDLYGPWPYSLSDTARHEVLASPSCGAADPQGGIPTSVTWGDCP